MDNFSVYELQNIILKHGVSDVSTITDKVELWYIIQNYHIIQEIQYNSYLWHQITKPYHFTIRDVHILKKGDSIDVIFLNDSFLELHNKHLNTVYTPRTFFRTKELNSYKYIHDEGLKGSIKLGKDWKPFSWEIENKNGKFVSFDSSENSPIYLNTRIGWKGPCVLSKNLDFYPNILI